MGRGFLAVACYSFNKLPKVPPIHFWVSPGSVFFMFDSYLRIIILRMLLTGLVKALIMM